MKVLFVCSGNICRSPMAAAYMQYRAAQQGLAHVVVESAGTLEIEGAPAAEAAVRTLLEAGLDLSAHRSRGVTVADLRSSDFVIAMAAEHLEELDRLQAPGRERRLLLRAFEEGPSPRPDPPDLADPIAQGLEIYRERFDTIRTCVDHLVLHLRHLGPADDDG